MHLQVIIFQMPNISGSVEYNVWKSSSVISVNFISYVGLNQVFVKIESVLLGHSVTQA